jgi:hypothetical protein
VEHFYRQQEPYRWEGIKPTVKAEKPQENHRENQLFCICQKKLEKKLRKKGLQSVNRWKPVTYRRKKSEKKCKKKLQKMRKHATL